MQEEIRRLVAYEVTLNDDSNFVDETVTVLVQDMTQAVVLAHEMGCALAEIPTLAENMQGEIKPRSIIEMMDVVAPEYGFSVENWAKQIRKTIESQVGEDDG